LVESDALTAGHDGAVTLGELLRGAAAAWPEAVFVRIGAGNDLPPALRLGVLDALADHYAARLAETALPEASRVLLLGASEPRTLAAIVGISRAGFEVALAPPALDARSIAAAAEACGASVLAGPAAFAELRTGERLFEAAALSDAITLVALHGPAEAGAFALDAPREGSAPVEAPTREGGLFAVDVLDATPRCRAISQARAGDIARDYLARVQFAAGEPIVSILSLASEAGLVGGAFAPLMGGAHMIWQAPFAARRFLETLQTSAPAHLFAPAGMASELGAAEIATADLLSSLTLATAAGVPAPPFAHGLDPARIFLLRAGESSDLSLERLHDWPARTPAQ
jgi:acyl-CoA synthetase (AMP-forming)/AMP-acid ligase II